MRNGNVRQTPPTDNDSQNTAIVEKDEQLIKKTETKAAKGFLKSMLGIGVGIWLLRLFMWLFTEGGSDPSRFLFTWGVVMVMLLIVFVLVPALFEKITKNK